MGWREGKPSSGQLYPQSRRLAHGRENPQPVVRVHGPEPRYAGLGVAHPPPRGLCLSKWGGRRAGWPGISLLVRHPRFSTAIFHATEYAPRSSDTDANKEGDVYQAKAGSVGWMKQGGD